MPLQRVLFPLAAKRIGGPTGEVPPYFFSPTFSGIFSRSGAFALSTGLIGSQSRAARPLDFGVLGSSATEPSIQASVLRNHVNARARQKAITYSASRRLCEM